MKKTSSAKCANFTISGTTECRSSRCRRNSSGTEPRLVETLSLGNAASNFTPFIGILAVQFPAKSCNQRTKCMGTTFEDATSRTPSLQNQSEVLINQEEAIHLFIEFLYESQTSLNKRTVQLRGYVSGCRRHLFVLDPF